MITLSALRLLLLKGTEGLDAYRLLKLMAI